MKDSSGKTQDFPDRSIINRRLIREKGPNPGRKGISERSYPEKRRVSRTGAAKTKVSSGKIALPGQKYKSGGPMKGRRFAFEFIFLHLLTIMWKRHATPGYGVPAE